MTLQEMVNMGLEQNRIYEGYYNVAKKRIDEHMRNNET